MSSDRHRRGGDKRRRRRTPAGSSPGTLIADPEAPQPALTLFAYGPDHLIEEKVTDLEALRPLCAGERVVWLNCDGLGDARTIEKIGDVFGLHRLALEDVLNTHQRPKVETYGAHTYIVARMVPTGSRTECEQLSMFLGPNFVLTFQEYAGDNFDPVRARIRAGKGLSRKSGPDYLCYTLLDAVIDEYFPHMERIGERLEALEDDILANARPSCVQDLHHLKRELLTLRRAVWPMREVAGFLLRDQSSQLKPETRVYMNDCYDHTVQLMDLVETYREIATGTMEIYLSSLSNRLNEVMKVLTMIATIFIPLTFITSIYGMNFDTSVSRWNMPELGWRYGYPAVIAVMLVVAVLLVGYFRAKRWIGAGSVRGDRP